MGLKELGGRLKVYIDEKGYTMARTGFLGDISASQVYNILNGKKFGTDKIFNLMNGFPDLNIMWLLTGEGNMIQENYEEGVVEKKVCINLKDKVPFKSVGNARE